MTTDTRAGCERKLLLGTHNKGKAGEFKELVGDPPPFTLITPYEQGISISVEETGSSFGENASIKARAYAASSGLITLADDSGLEVDALDKAPGHLSARYAGPNASDSEHISLLLKNLAGVPSEKRTARFVCVIALATLSGKVELCRGSCEGIIAMEPAGTSGFGYDPVFYLPSHGRTMAQLTMKEKNRISHRAQAMRQAIPIVDRMFRDCEE